MNSRWTQIIARGLQALLDAGSRLDPRFIRARDFRKLWSVVGRLDPRVVRLRDPRRYPRRLSAAILLGIVLVLGAVSVAATRKGSKKQILPEPLEPPPERPKKQIITKTTLVPPEDPDTAIEENDEKRHPRFFDPVYVFTDDPVQRVSAYPLASPPGIVVDLIGATEPTGDATDFVGKDDRVRAVRRRNTAQGLRYIIGLTTPIRHIDVVYEGQVAMIFPRS